MYLRGRFTAGAAALVVLLVIGIVGHMAIEGWSFLDAVYMTIVTFTTVGYAEVDPDELRSVFRKAIEETRALIVLTFAPGGITGNPDHVAVTEATTRAFLDLFHNRQQTGPTEARLYCWTIPETIATRLRAISDVGFSGTPETSITNVIDTSASSTTQ